MEMLTFEEYLKGKKIDPDLFRSAEPGLWDEYKMLFDRMHPESFTAQKLFKINGIRRKYPFKGEIVKPQSAAPVVSKPKVFVKPKIK